MPEPNSHRGWVDRYVRSEMTEQEVAFFEDSLMESPALQRELETVLALRALVSADQDRESAAEAQHEPPQAPALAETGGWQGLALAATVVLAVFSTVMFWKSGNDAAALREQIAQLSQPRTNVLSVPVNITRSAGARTPDVIVKKPAGNSALLLDVELTPAMSQADAVFFSLRRPDGDPVMNWESGADTQGRTTVILNSEDVPTGQLWLDITSPGGGEVDRRVLEIR